MDYNSEYSEYLRSKRNLLTINNKNRIQEWKNKTQMDYFDILEIEKYSRVVDLLCWFISITSQRLSWSLFS